MAREKICGIYCIKNLINEKCYIGQSKDIYKRWVVHKGLLNRGKHPNISLQTDWTKYSETNFDFYIIEPCAPESLNMLEISYIHDLGTFWDGYNNDFGGKGYVACRSDVEYAIYQKRYADKALSIKKPITQLTLNGDVIQSWDSVTDAWKYYGFADSKAIRECADRSNKSRKSAYGFIWMWTSEYNEKPSLVSYYLNAHRKPVRKVQQYDKDMNLIAIYESCSDANRHTNIKTQNINDCCNNKRKSAGGFIWKYIN